MEPSSIQLKVYTWVHAQSRQSCPALQPQELLPIRFLCPWDSPGKNAGVGFHTLLQGIFPTQGSNPHVLYLQYWGGFFTAKPRGSPLRPASVSCEP